MATNISDIINNAMAACGGSGSCQELAIAIADAVAAGIKAGNNADVVLAA